MHNKSKNINSFFSNYGTEFHALYKLLTYAGWGWFTGVWWSSCGWLCIFWADTHNRMFYIVQTIKLKQAGVR